MAYPDNYESIEGIREESCAAYAASARNGIDGDYYQISLGSMMKVFGVYSYSEAPLLAIIKYDQTYMVKDIPGVPFNGTGSYYFDIFIGDLGDPAETGIWQDGDYILKLYSADNESIYTKAIKLMRPANMPVTLEELKLANTELGALVNDNQTLINENSAKITNGTGNAASISFG